MSKNKNKIEINIIGTASEDVTGSCVWVKTPNVQILIECGLYQVCGKNAILKQYTVNNEHFPFHPKDIDYIFVCHTHQDHLGRVPKVYQMGAQCPLIMPAGSKKVAQLLMEDSAHILESDARYLSKKFNRDYSPVYTIDDVDTSLYHLYEYPIGQEVQLDEFVKFKFISSGHILNSAQLELYITNGNLVKKILYTSDLGNVLIKKPYVREIDYPERVNIVIGESTYGAELHEANEKIRMKDLEKIRASVEKIQASGSGRIMIPVFANSRCQEMLTYLYGLFGEDSTFKIPVLVDSPLALSICSAYDDLLEGEDKDLWKQVRQWKNVVWLQDSDDSRAWRTDKRPLIVLCSSGMITQGRSVMWAAELLPNPDNIILFCGFSAKGSLGDQIKHCKNNKGTIYFPTIDKVVHKNCQIVNLTSFSSHMQRQSLRKYYGSLDFEKLILVHGSEQSKLSIVPEIEEELYKNDKSSKVVCATKDYSIKI